MDTTGKGGFRKPVIERVGALQRRSIGRWPSPQLSWDVEPANWHRSMDDYACAADLMERFPDLELAWVDVAELKTALGPTWRRTSPAASGYRSKSAKLVVHLEDGGSVSPPFVQPIRGRLEVNGGNHRIGWAIHVGATRMPILLLQTHWVAALRLMPSLGLKRSPMTVQCHPEQCRPEDPQSG